MSVIDEFNVLSAFTLYGQREYLAPEIGRDNCSIEMERISALSNGYQQDHPCLPLAVVNIVQAEKKRKIDITQLHRAEHEYKLQQFPEAPPFIYERDEIERERQIRWQSRIGMIDAAYKCRSLFALSIVPTDASAHKVEVTTPQAGAPVTSISWALC